MGKISMRGYAEMKIKADMTRYTITFNNNMLGIAYQNVWIQLV